MRHGIAFASAVIGIAVIVSSPPTRAEITAVVIDQVEPFAEGMSFGDVGGLGAGVTGGAGGLCRAMVELRTRWAAVR